MSDVPGSENQIHVNSVFILAKPIGKFLTAELAALLLKTLTEKSNPENTPETNDVFCRLALRMLFSSLQLHLAGAPTKSIALLSSEAEKSTPMALSTHEALHG